MGSRTRPNLGGSGAPKTRQDWVIHKHNPRHAEKNVPFTDIESLKEYLSTTLIYCLECGWEGHSLGHHLYRTHTMNSEEYKTKYNIPKTYSLRSLSSQKKSSEKMKAVWSSGAMDNLRPILRERLKKANFAHLNGNAYSTISHTYYTKNCLTCGKGFTRRRDDNKYCSKVCHTASEIEQSRLREISAKGGAARAAIGKKDSMGKFV